MAENNNPTEKKQSVPRQAAATSVAKEKDAGLAKRGVLKLNITDEKLLYNCYMPFIKGCGVFVPTEETFKLSDEVFLLLNLPKGGKFAVSGKVVWLSPKQKTGKKVAGIGLQILGSNAEKVKTAFEDLLGKRVKAAFQTYTM